MTDILKGAPLVDKLCAELIAKVKELSKQNIKPCLAIVRVGAKPNDISYENTILKRCEKIGVVVKQVVLAEDIPAEDFYAELENLNADCNVHGILMFRPLPSHIDGEKARNLIAASKDVDGSTDASLAGIFTDSDVGFPPCTASAAMEILDFYGVELSGKNAVVLGRSLVIGKPVAMMLLRKNASVTICHSRTKNIEELSRSADILIACTGQPESVGPEYVNPNQCIIDVGVSYSEAKQKLCGDVDFDAVSD
ncbi:MAG: bifunctional 5,10-methylenetetrahydrofolate dehydrogenase/5,10-methenyltetrahydrofolate cyclohydrolase, partial [[Eubacterium] sulci]|nr:bifunctional 5,10-methylenetetrahydrofolate dehydrogenase/5,10-methenyltetrahydrofolate cyclohydrolase [[Eubacterium] sulci]